MNSSWEIGRFFPRNGFLYVGKLGTLEVYGRRADRTAVTLFGLVMVFCCVWVVCMKWQVGN